MLALGTHAGCETQPPADAESLGGGSSGLCLELTPGRTHVQLGEPLVVAVSLRNCSKEPRQLEDLLAPEYGFLQVSLSPPGGGKPIRWRPPARRDARAKRPSTLLPGERFTAWIHLYASADGWTLRLPGRYEIRAEYSTNGQRVSAPPVAVLVEAPKTPDESAAAELFMDEAAALLLRTGHEQGEQGSARLSELVQEHPESPLAPYASTAIGIGRAQERFDPELKTFRTADCEGAVALLKPAVPRLGDPFLAAVGTQTLATCLRRLGRAEEARQVIDGYSRSRPGAQQLPGVPDVLHGEDQRFPARANP